TSYLILLFFFMYNLLKMYARSTLPFKFSALVIFTCQHRLTMHSIPTFTVANIKFVLNTVLSVIFFIPLH
ncbi:unnamed protein product, partial [Coccothraustes coccothraustes]